MNQPVRLKDYLGSPAAQAAKQFNDRLTNELKKFTCPRCGFVLESHDEHQDQHVCKVAL